MPKMHLTTFVAAVLLLAIMGGCVGDGEYLVLRVQGKLAFAPSEPVHDDVMIACDPLPMSAALDTHTGRLAVATGADDRGIQSMELLLLDEPHYKAFRGCWPITTMRALAGSHTVRLHPLCHNDPTLSITKSGDIWSFDGAVRGTGDSWTVAIDCVGSGGGDPVTEGRWTGNLTFSLMGPWSKGEIVRLASGQGFGSPLPLEGADVQGMWIAPVH